MFNDQEDGMPVYRPTLELIAMTCALWAVIIATVMVAVMFFQ
jgi:hypothetical protein